MKKKLGKKGCCWAKTASSQIKQMIDFHIWFCKVRILNTYSRIMFLAEATCLQGSIRAIKAIQNIFSMSLLELENKKNKISECISDHANVSSC